MKELLLKLKDRLRKVPKRKLIAISITVKVVEVAVSTYILKRFFLN
ncbi:hypothetical protein [Thermovibrio sp.]